VDTDPEPAPQQPVARKEEAPAEDGFMTWRDISSSIERKILDAFCQEKFG
jgi:hypothetical protein